MTREEAEEAKEAEETLAPDPAASWRDREEESEKKDEASPEEASPS
jgi:hypothetical protein